MVERYAQGASHHKSYATPADKTVLELWTEPMTREAIKAVRKDAKKQETRSLKGALIFVASVMRVDVAQAVSRVARHIHNPNETVHAAAMRILLYLNQTRDLGNHHLRRIEGLERSRFDSGRACCHAPRQLPKCRSGARASWDPSLHSMAQPRGPRPLAPMLTGSPSPRWRNSS